MLLEELLDGVILHPFKGQVHVFAGRVKIESHSSCRNCHSSCRTSAILKYFCPLCIHRRFTAPSLWGHVVQLVTCLTTDTCLNADPGISRLIPAWSHTFVEIDHEIISTTILLPSADSRRVVISYKQKYVHKVLVTCLVKLAQEKVW